MCGKPEGENGGSAPGFSKFRQDVIRLRKIPRRMVIIKKITEETSIVEWRYKRIWDYLIF